MACVGATERMVVIRDVSDLRALAEQMVHAHTMESVGRLAGGVAHDSNNVLHVLRGHASALARHIDDPKVTERRVGAIVRAADRTSALVDQLTVINRPAPNDPQPTTVERLLIALRPAPEQLLGTSVRLDCELGAPDRAVVIDESRFENVILDLTTNARDAVGTGGVVTVRTRLAGDATVILEFVDDGVGMDDSGWELRSSTASTGSPAVPRSSIGSGNHTAGVR